MKKEHSIHFRVTDEEYEHLNKLVKESGKSTSQVLRKLIIDNKNGGTTTFEPKEHFMLTKQLIYEINRIGNNINQIAKNNNSHYYTPNEKEKLLEMMGEIQRKLE